MIKPRQYHLIFEPDLKNFTFKGEEKIIFDITENTTEVILDLVNLQVSKAELLLGRKNIVSSFKVDEKNQKLIIQISKKLGQGRYELFISFKGELKDTLAGFYRSKYVVNKKEKYLATTQFEAADARRAFPCVDDPSYKATFDVSFVIDKNLQAVSNTLPKRVEKLAEGKKRVMFETTPKMSTYLLYLGVGEFEWIESKYRNILLKVVTTQGKKQYGKFALECAKKCLQFYERYFDYPYPLKKLDLLAIPDFASGAMENWGAIAFRENALLFYPGKSSKATMQRIAEVVAHELVHQWFGNLVTMKWWDDLWLNESFATYMAYKAMDYFWPEWKVWDQYVIDTVFEAMGLDSLKTSHSIKVFVNKISEIDELFDEIAYEKGGSILRMLDLYLGEDTFRDGLRSYIKKFAYKNAEANDLWTSLQSHSDKPVSEIMQKYITQVGFPLITVSKMENTFILDQKRFLFNGEDKKLQWVAPLVMRDEKNNSHRITLRKRTSTFRLNQKDGLITINKNYSSFFVSSYSRELLSRLGKNGNLLGDSDKIGLIHDLFLLIFSGKKRLAEFYDLVTDFFYDERSSIVLHYIIAKLTGLYLLLKDEKSKKLAIQFSKHALDKIVGYNPKREENILNTYLRATSLSSLTLFDDKKVEEFAMKQFLSYLKNEKTLHPDLRALVYSSAIWFEDSNYHIIKNLYRSSSVQEEKAKLLMALGHTKNKQLIEETLEYSLQKEVPFAFIPYAIISVARNPYAKELVLNWLMKHWGELVKRSGGLANVLLRRILQSIVPISGIGRESEIKNFLGKNRISGLERTVDQVLEELTINSRFVERNKH